MLPWSEERHAKRHPEHLGAVSICVLVVWWDAERLLRSVRMRAAAAIRTLLPTKMLFPQGRGTEGKDHLKYRHHDPEDLGKVDVVAQTGIRHRRIDKPLAVSSGAETHSPLSRGWRKLQCSVLTVCGGPKSRMFLRGNSSSENAARREPVHITDCQDRRGEDLKCSGGKVDIEEEKELCCG